jgi:hypothetical protein
MQIPVQVVFHGLAHSDALQELLRELAAKACRPRLGATRCQVAVELPHRHQQQGRPFSVRVVFSVAGEDVVAHAEDPDARVAAREAFAVLQRQLDDRARRARDQARHAGRGGEAKPG